MNQKRFERFQKAISEELLEEAQIPKKHRWGLYAGVAAACLCAVLMGIVALGGGKAWATQENETQVSLSGPTEEALQFVGNTKLEEAEQTEIAVTNPVRAATEAELVQLGYAMAIPQDAQDTAYSFIRLGETEQDTIAQATFLLDETAYTCRTMKTDRAQDISGVCNTEEDRLDWTVGSTQLSRCDGDASSWVSWYVPEEQTQWCLSAETDSGAILQTARNMASDLGHTVDAAPEGAQEVQINAFLLDDLTVAETAFVLDGLRWTYRTAAVCGVELVDISEAASVDYAVSAAGMVAYCDAQLFWNDQAAGKIIWFDVVPGLTYSLLVDGGASEQLLLEMAQTLFSPAQGDVG